MSICSGCLSRGRILKPLKSIAMTRTLDWLKLDAFAAWSMLCWECEADLARADRFRRRAQLAQFMFSKQKIKKVISKENVMTVVISKEFALGLGDLVLSTMSTVLIDEENHIHIEQDECPIEAEIKQEISDPISFREELSDPLNLKEEVSAPVGNYSEKDVILEGNSDLTDENVHQLPMSWSIHQQSMIVISDIKSEITKSFANNSSSEASITAIAPKSQNGLEFVQEGNTAYKVMNAARTLANSTAQISTKTIATKSEKSMDFIPEEKTAYKVIDVTEEEMFRYRELAKNEDAFKSCYLKCKLCIQLFKTQTEYNAHSKLHWKCAGQLLCEICLCRFENENIFKQHCADHSKVYECLKCSYQHPNKDAMHEHMKSTHNIFLCQFCFMELDCNIEPTDHVVSAHQMSCQKRSHKCEQCGKIFKYPTVLKKHMEIHLETSENRKKVCPHCHQRVIHIDRHILKFHSRNPESYCGTCQKQFVCVDTYKKHLQTSRVHNPAGQPKKQAYCDICMESFESIGKYKKHMRNRHAQKAALSKFECKHCLKQFQNQMNLQSHIKVVHEQKRPFRCLYHQCSFTAPSSTVLNVHIRRTHEAHIYKRSERKKDMMCQYCSAGFYTSAMLQRHILTHTGEKLYHCAHCEWKFASRGTFITHLRGKHSKVGPPREKRKKDMNHK